MRGKLVVAICLGLLAVATAASTAAADGAPQYVTNLYYNCVDDHNIGVPAGSELVLRLPWGAKTRGLAESFVQGISMSVSVAGSQVPDPLRYWSEPEYRADLGYWVTTWLYPTGVVSTFENPYSIDVEVYGERAVLDGLTFASSEDSRPYFWNTLEPMFGSSGSCSVTGF